MVVYQEFTITGLDTNMKWILLFDCRYKRGKLQVAKVPISMYSTNKHLVQWTIWFNGQWNIDRAQCQIEFAHSLWSLNEVSIES